MNDAEECCRIIEFLWELWSTVTETNYIELAQAIVMDTLMQRALRKRKTARKSREY